MDIDILFFVRHPSSDCCGCVSPWWKLPLMPESSMTKSAYSRLAALSLTLVVGVGIALAQAQTPAKDPAIERARKQAMMLDDLYKTAIVVVTEGYVNEKSDVPAGTAFQQLFGAMKKKGWHEVRLLDATGGPLVETNAPNDDFEKAAIKALLDGKPTYEAVVTKQDKRSLRIATAVPPVLEKCHICHDNYRGKKVIGALSYTIPIE
jgi:hypothetical protein